MLHHTKILPVVENDEIVEDIEETDLLLEELSDTLKVLNFSDGMQVEEFLTLSEENIVYEVPEEDHIITELVDIFKQRPDENLDGDERDDDSIEIELVSISSASRSLENIRTFLLQQEGATKYLKSVNNLERFIREIKSSLMKQTTLEQFF